MHQSSHFGGSSQGSMTWQVLDHPKSHWRAPALVFMSDGFAKDGLSLHLRLYNTSLLTTNSPHHRLVDESSSGGQQDCPLPMFQSPQGPLCLHDLESGLGASPAYSTDRIITWLHVQLSAPKKWLPFPPPPFFFLPVCSSTPRRRSPWVSEYLGLLKGEGVLWQVYIHVLHSA